MRNHSYGSPQMYTVGGKNDTYLDRDGIGVNFLGREMLNTKNLKRKEKG